MSDVKRYDFSCSILDGLITDICDDGYYVLHSDYAAILASHNALVEACHALLGAYSNGEFEPSMRLPLVVRESALKIAKIARDEVAGLIGEEGK